AVVRNSSTESMANVSSKEPSFAATTSVSSLSRDPRGALDQGDDRPIGDALPVRKTSPPVDRSFVADVPHEFFDKCRLADPSCPPPRRRLARPPNGADTGRFRHHGPRAPWCPHSVAID